MKLELQGIRVPLSGFDLEVDAAVGGDVVALFGPSGAGKTSLLDAVAGLVRPRAGRIVLDGRVLVDVEARVSVPARARGIGYVPQDHALFPHLSVRRNVLFGMHAPAGGNGTFSLGHVAEVLEIDRLLERGIEKLSGGERQRVAVARAILSRPQLLLLDEPLTGLDEPLKEKTRGLLRRVRAEFRVPMLYVTHAAEEIMALCDCVVVLERGRVLRHGSPAEIFERTDVPTLRLRPDRR